MSLQEILIPGAHTEADCHVRSFCLLTGVARRKLVESLVIDVACWVGSGEQMCIRSLI